MLPSEIITALPRQKVKNTESGAIADVLGTTHDGTTVAVRVSNDGDSWIENWITRYCEPVPEEPRPFRVGDKVKCIYTSVFSTIKQVRIAENGWPEQYEVDDVWKPKENIRHATPEEIARHFAPNA
jgi:hypothetical protein